MYKSNIMPERYVYGAVPEHEAYGRAGGGVPSRQAYGSNNNGFNSTSQSEPQLDEYGVDHSNFSVRDELEYQFKRASEREQGGLPVENNTEQSQNIWGSSSVATPSKQNSWENRFRQPQTPWNNSIYGNAVSGSYKNSFTSSLHNPFNNYMGGNGSGFYGGLNPTNNSGTQYAQNTLTDTASDGVGAANSDSNRELVITITKDFSNHGGNSGVNEDGGYANTHLDSMSVNYTPTPWSSQTELKRNNSRAEFVGENEPPVTKARKFSSMDIFKAGMEGFGTGVLGGTERFVNGSTLGLYDMFNDQFFGSSYEKRQEWLNQLAEREGLRKHLKLINYGIDGIAGALSPYIASKTKPVINVGKRILQNNSPKIKKGYDTIKEYINNRSLHK